MFTKKIRRYLISNFVLAIISFSVSLFHFFLFLCLDVLRYGHLILRPIVVLLVSTHVRCMTTDCKLQLILGYQMLKVTVK